MKDNSHGGARQAALENLERFRRDGAWSGSGIDSAIKKYSLDGREAALTARLCLGVLQNSSLCDYYIGCYCRSKLEPKVRDILRLGVYQLLFMDKIPARAAVSESVALCKVSGYARAAGLVNAVLRRVAENADALPEIPGQGTAKYLSIKYSHPEWLVQYVMDRKGYAFAEAFLAANNRPAGLTIQVNRSAVALPGFDQGLFYVQDRAARTAVEIASPKPGMQVLDACSCPGGKSFAAAIAMENWGSILSCDIHEKKLRLVRSGAERMGITIIDTCPRDAREPDESLHQRFDLVIADVPCSGLGVIGKKPEIRNKDRASLEGLPAIQRDILRNLSDFVRPGGTLLYSTCTILEEENQAVVRSFLSERNDYMLEGFSVAGIDCPEGMYTFWPNVDGTDGFFAAKLKRKH